MKSKFALTMVGLLTLAVPAYADDVAVIANPPTLITLLIFAAACACVAVCFQVFLLVRGGQLSRSWQFFLAGFGVLAASQLGIVLHNFGAIVIPSWLVPTLLVVMSGLFFYGLYETKRVLG
jgi:hypothetical protein